MKRSEIRIKNLVGAVFLFSIFSGCIDAQQVEVSQVAGSKAASTTKNPIAPLGPGNGDLPVRLTAVSDRINILRQRLLQIKNDKTQLETQNGNEFATLENQLVTLSQQLNLMQTQILGLPEAACARIQGATWEGVGTNKQCRLPAYPAVPVQKTTRVLFAETSIFNCALGTNDSCGMPTIPVANQAGSFRQVNMNALPLNAPGIVDATQMREFIVPRAEGCELIEIRLKAHAFFNGGNPWVKFKLSQNGADPLIKTACSPLDGTVAGSNLGCDTTTGNWHPRETVLTTFRAVTTQGLPFGPTYDILKPMEVGPYEVFLNKVAGSDGEGTPAFRAREFFVEPNLSATEDKFKFEVSYFDRGLPTGGTVTILCIPQTTSQ
jgi:hypothetical protein